jgi:hypothetical protein
MTSCQYLYPPLNRTHVSISCDVPSPGITQGICFLGHPAPPSLAAWLPAQSIRELRGVTSFRMSIFVALGRYFTPGSFRVVAIFPVDTMAWNQFPFGPACWKPPTNQRGQVHLDDASDIPSLEPFSFVLTIATCSTRSPCLVHGLSPSHPCS